MDQARLSKINTLRRRQGKAPLSYAQASSLIEQRRKADDYHRDETLDFLIGYTTGIPMPSTGGIVGAMLHTSYDQIQSNPTPASDPDSGGSYGGGSASSSFDSSSSSSDSSSSSSDSGSSSSGSSE